MTAKWKALVLAVPAFACPIAILIYVPFTVLPDRSAGSYASHLDRYWISYVMVVMLLGWVAFLIDALRSRRVPDVKRKLWVALLVFGAFNVMPFYWWWYVRVGGRPSVTETE